MTLGQIISEFRNKHSMSMDKFSELSGLSKGYISMLENNKNPRTGKPIIPSLDMYNNVAKAINVSLDILLDMVDDSTEIFLSSYKDISKNERRLLSVFKRLDDVGQAAVINTADGLEASGKYDRPAEDSAAVISEPVAAYSVARAAAGAGALNDGYAEPEMRLIKSETIPAHDAVIDIVGDSMEPSIKDGDVAFICYNYEKKDGRLYAVNVRDETVIKRVYFYSDHSVLVSDNPAYEDRIITEADNASIAGEVVGWTTPIRE